MARPIRTVPDAAKRALDDARETHSAAQLRAALTVLLPAAGLSIEQTARVLGRSRTWVSRARNRFMSGQTDFPEAWGGRRQAVLPEDRELQLVKLAIVDSRQSSEHVRHHLRERLAELDLYPAESTITAMLARAAARLMPDGDGQAWELERWSGFLAQIVKLEQHLQSLRPPRKVRAV